MSKQKKIVVVEDDSQIRDVLVRKLKDEGFDVVSAEDGKTGLEKALDEKPDLLLLDLILPEMDGMTLLEKLREDEFGEDLPVIILTNLENAEKIEESRERGVNDFLVKTDWSLDDVVTKIRSTLKDNELDE